MFRPALVALLVVAGIASAGFLWFTEQRIATSRQQAAAMEARADALLHGIADLSASLQAYVAPGQNITAWTERSAALLKQLTDHTAALGTDADAADALAALRPGIDTLTRLEAQVRDYLRSGDDLMAADLAFNEARDTTTGVVSALRDWRARREAWTVAGVRAAEVQQAAAFGGVLLAWALSLGVVAWGRGRGAAGAAPHEASETVAEAGLEAAAEADVLSLSLDTARTVGGSARVDLTIVASVCGDLACASDSSALRTAIGRGAEALGARGVVVWLGVGEELFAVASHGYDERHLRRPINRNAKNVTAEAWRTAQAVLVPTEADSPGVVVVPMVGASGCRGVVSAELLPGRAASADCQALLAMFAAQIVGLVGAAPAPAVAQPPQAETAAAVDQLPAEQAS